MRVFSAKALPWVMVALFVLCGIVLAEGEPTGMVEAGCANKIEAGPSGKVEAGYANKIEAGPSDKVEGIQAYLPTKLPEKLYYDISYGPFDVGKSTMEVLNNDDGTVSIITIARSEGWVDDVYPVDDFAESVVEDFTSLVPVRYLLKTREGKGRKHREVIFDHVDQKATYIDYLSQENTEYDIPARVFDPLAAFFFTRRLILEPGKNQTVPMFDSKKFWPLMVKVVKRQRIEVPLGKFDTVMISPVMQSEGIFSRTGDMYIWVTDDALRIPVLIKSKVLIGSVKVKLTGASY